MKTIPHPRKVNYEPALARWATHPLQILFDRYLIYKLSRMDARLIGSLRRSNFQVSAQPFPKTRRF